MSQPDLECRLLDACIIAYDIKNGAIDPNVPYYGDVGIKPGTTPTVFVDGVEEINAGFVAETEDDWVFLAYRGTLPPFKGDFWRWITDWLNDFRAGPMSWQVDGAYFGQVETGFGSAVHNTWADALAGLQAIDIASKKGIIVTGHSKGGGMSFPAATLVKAAFPSTLVEVCTFAAPLTCDRTFRQNYDARFLRPFTVRYENRYDIVPFLPYWPTFAMLATAERRDTGANTVITEANWPTAVENEYVPIGILRYLGDGCRVEYGEKGANDAWNAIKYALEHLELETIADAHSATGRYHTCVCGGSETEAG